MFVSPFRSACSCTRASAGADDDSEVGRADTYKQSRLAKMGAGDAGATGTKREMLGTEYDLEGAGDGDGNQNMAGTVELERPTAAAATTSTLRD